MRRVTLRSIWEHKRRLISTVVAIVLGVAFLSGTAVFADTLDEVFDDLFATANENVDARVQGEVLFTNDFGGGEQRDRFDEAVLDDVAAVDGVAVAAPFTSVIGFGSINRVLDDEGEPVGASNGPPTLIESWVDSDELRPYRLTDGSRGPEADDEIALNVGAVEDAAFDVGDTITVATQFGNAEYTLVGTFTFGDAESAAGAVSAEFTLAEAQRLAGAEGKLDAIFVTATEGVSQEEIRDRIAEVTPDGTEVITGEAAAEQDASDVQEGFAFFQVALSVFGGIAVVVATFIIANTFQILVAQRTRELALLRAVGASRRQVLGSVLLEAVVVGLVASVLGIVVGIALAAGITALMDALGADLPTGTLVVGPATIVNGLVVGLLVTVTAAISPAIRATRVPPLAALRDVAVDRAGASRLRLVAGALLLAVGAFNLSKAFGNDGDTDVIPTVGLGALMLIVGAIVIGPVLASPSVRTFGAILPRFRGVTGRLAVENAARSPKRTSATASALLIGVALIGFITVFAESAKKSVRSEVERGLAADIIVQGEGGPFGGFSGFSPAVAERVGEIDGIEAVAGFAADGARITYPDGHTADSFIGGVDPPAYDRVSNPRMEEGEFLDLEPGTVLVDRQVAEDNDLSIGSSVSMLFGSGERLEVEVAAISDDLVVLAPWVVHVTDLADVVAQRLDFQVFATVGEGRDVGDVLAAVESGVDEFTQIEVLDRDGFIGDFTAQLTSFVFVIYALLGLSIIIAMIGVANTLSLSIHERTRELGLLRAVGMERSQLRSAIRWEAVLIAVLGTVVGLGLGMIVSYALVQALDGFGLTTFAVPIATLVILVIVAAAFAVLASLRTASKAAKLDILRAIATE